MKQIMISIFGILMSMVLPSALPAYAQQSREEQVMEGLLTNTVEGLTPALDVMRRHKARLEEQLSEDRTPGGRGSSGPLAPDPARPDPERDPFATTPLMEQTAIRGQKSGLDFTPLPTASPTPDLKLRGIVSAGDGARVALLDVTGSGVYLVREGDTISLRGSERNTVIKVEKMNHLTLTVSVGTLGEVVIVR